MMEPVFGDNVRIRSVPETLARGLAGRLGNVYGETALPFAGVEIIGESTANFALNVYFEELGESFWFAPHLVEFIDHAPGTEISLEGLNKRWVRSATGEWVEHSTEPNPAETTPVKTLQRPWWKFW